MDVLPFIAAPVHGDRGDFNRLRTAPAGITVAVSREAGARGGSIARRIGRRLGWQVYNQELLEFLCNNEAARGSITNDLPQDARDWIETQMIRARNEFQLDDHPEAGEMPRVVLTLAARGQVILVGRGAGYYLPRDTSLHIRVVAPLEERVSHLADWLRLTKEAAAIEVTNRDDARASFLLKHFGKREVDLYDFDLVINSGLLNEETCADTITAIIMGKQDQIYPE